MSDSTGWSGSPHFAHRGFYMHAAWKYDYPFAVRTWARADYQAMFELLGQMNMDQVMLWPPFEMLPAPLSPADTAVLVEQRGIVADAKDRGLSCWVVLTANVICEPAIADRPVPERHFYPFKRQVRLDDVQARQAYLQHRRDMLTVLNNADAYVTIDGDPGGYAYAKPEQLLSVLEADRRTLDRVGARADEQAVMVWLWCGWGRPVREDYWSEPVGPYTRAFVERLAGDGPAEPWGILAGRSHREDWANGRVNVQAVADAGLMERSTVMFYEAIEFEPTPPAVVVQFELIRQMLRQEAALAGAARGAMGNAQQPICALHNLYFFARATWDLDYLDRTDEQVLADFAAFLGGPAELLVPAWRCLDLDAEHLDPALPQRLIEATLNGPAARCIPGGPQGYLQMLAGFTRARLAVLALAGHTPRGSDDAAEALAEAIAAVIVWWRRHHYVASGEAGERFGWAFTHPRLTAAIQSWADRHAPCGSAVRIQAGRRLADRANLTVDEAAEVLADL